MADNIEEIKRRERKVIEEEMANVQNLAIGEAKQVMSKASPLGLYDSLRCRLTESQTSESQIELIRKLKAQLKQVQTENEIMKLHVAELEESERIPKLIVKEERDRSPKGIVKDYQKLKEVLK